MQSDEFLIEKIKKLFESSTGWGDSAGWTNQDFVVLSEKIQDKTGVALSHVTLKRVWGKVKYESLPNTHTLDTLVQFLGYESFREFKSQNGNGHAAVASEHVKPETTVAPGSKSSSKSIKLILVPVLIVTVITAVILILSLNKSKPVINDKDYAFSSKKIVSQGVPNSVVFNYEATKSPYDSVIIQQSWDRHLQTKVSKNDHQHTSIYYYPDYYKAKLIVGGKIVSMHRLLIKSDGWMPIVEQSPVPVYFKKEDAMINGKMALSIDKIQSRNIKMQPSPPTVLYTNVRDFGEIYSDDFVFETSVKNDYHEGASVCQLTTIYLLCEGTAVVIPLSAKGCVSSLEMYFTNYYKSGRNTDLSAFGVDFSSFIKVRIESLNGKGRVFLNDKLVYTVDHEIVRSKIIGIDYSFQGTGSVDYIKLSNGKVKYEENF
jgi:hypothetical protein